MILLDDEEILERVDEYTLYCFYLGFEPQTSWAYHSPIREIDDHPSWSMFYCRHPYKTFKWKDNATKRIGDIFDLVQVKFGLLDRLNAYGKVAHDFGLMFDPKMDIQPKIKLFEVPPEISKEIRIKSRPLLRAQDLMFYDQFHIKAAQLHRYHATSFICYWILYTDPATGVERWSNPRFPRGLGFAYRIGTRYQIYQPNESKEWKFRTSLREEDVMGLTQLKGRTELLIITKSMKEVMFFDAIGIDAIASHSENRAIPLSVLNKVTPKYKQVAVWNDNDGKESALHYYPDLTRLYVPQSTGQKDPTDHRKHFGIAETLSMINHVITDAGLIIPSTLAA